MMKAKQTILAYQHLKRSVVKVYPEAYEKYLINTCGYYIGVKNTSLVHPLIQKLDEKKYFVHTVDKMSLNGRAVDEQLLNPITLRPMTGSSSGSAINVLLNINDLAIATDGGSSVLAPAISLNLYGFISKLLPVSKVLKKSTDSIEFYPSCGVISKKLSLIKEVINDLDIKYEIEKSENILYLNDESHFNNIDYDTKKPRKELIEDLEGFLNNYDYVISYESRIDIIDIGDSIYGCQKNLGNQNLGNKGIIRVINMIGATAITVPSDEISSAYVIVTKSEEKYLGYLFTLAQMLSCKENELIKSYYDIKFLEQF